MIVGNKIDLDEQRTVSKQRGLDYAESKKIAFYEVSAKDGTNINLIFTRIAEGNTILSQSWKKQSRSRRSARNRRPDPRACDLKPRNSRSSRSSMRT